MPNQENAFSPALSPEESSPGGKGELVRIFGIALDDYSEKNCELIAAQINALHKRALRRDAVVARLERPVLSSDLGERPNHLWRTQNAKDESRKAWDNVRRFKVILRRYGYGVCPVANENGEERSVRALL